MRYAKERVDIILGQLKNLILLENEKVVDFKVKDGCYVTPDEATASTEPWKDFDAKDQRWYGKDKHYWFRKSVVIPEKLQNDKVWLHVRTDLNDWDDGRNPQFLVFVDNVPIQGLDINHREILLPEEIVKKGKFELDLQAYTGTLHDEFKLLVNLEKRSEEVKDLYYDIYVPRQGLNRMDENEKTKWQIEEILTETINLIDLRHPHDKAFFASVKVAREYIRTNLYENPDMSGFDDIIATCIGHTHIDVAWLWTVAQVRQKSCRSFGTVLKLMEEYPDYKFMSSQPQLYEFVKERHPELYNGIKQRVAEGRWEPEGGMWVEADCNLTSGESLVRQFLFGKRFFKEEFGKDNEILWLPDVFGYSGALPQIMKKSGIKYFMTTKLAWNQINKVPMDTFFWEGIDGSKVFTHLITTLGVGQSTGNFFTTYNGMLHPDSIMGGWMRYQNKDINNDILVSYGFGDGGGGPTRDMLEVSTRMQKGIKGIPKVRQEFSHMYFDELYDRVKDSKRLPSWVGELYFEYHRGTLTSMGRNKRGNRKSEYRLMEAELFSVFMDGVFRYPTKELNDIWKVVLRNQFHDILPGSSIHEVYEVTKQEYAEITDKLENIIAERMSAIAGEGEGIIIFNTLGFTRNDIVELGNVDAKFLTDGQKVFPVQKCGEQAYAFVTGIPSKGCETLTACDGDDVKAPFTINGNTIDTPFYKAVINDLGEFESIYDKEAMREVLRPGTVGNELRVYEDKPMCFDNWDIDMFYKEKSWKVSENAKCEWIENGPVRAVLRVTKAMADTTFSQDIIFYADSRRIDFKTEFDWKMHQHLLKVHFPVDVHTDEAVFDIQFGNITRKIHENTSWDVARFESCAHKWMDMSEGGYGVSLMNDCKYGHSALKRVMSITLVKSGIEPNTEADVEKHVVTYSLLPHLGTWREANTVQESFNLNVPLRAIAGGSENTNFSYASCETLYKRPGNTENVILETIKKAEDGNGIILRLYETQNKRSTVKVNLANAIKSVVETNLMEEMVPADESGLKEVNGNNFVFEINPYEVKTFRIK